MAGYPDSRWVEVDLEAIRHNYRQIRRFVDKNVKILSVVKADAYGHGAVETARVLEEMGTDMLGVTTVQEGRKLREGQIAAPILVFGPFLPEEIAVAAGHDLTVTVAGLETLRFLEKAAVSYSHRIKIHLKVETGLGRTGLWPSETAETIRQVADIPGLELEGIYSHLATAMQNDKRYAYKQFNCFQETLALLEKEGLNRNFTRHISNSAAVLDLPEMNLDMVRVGTLLYGQYPHPRQEGRLDLKNPWSFKARVIYIRELPPGHSVGYGRTYKTKRPTRIAVLPVGFADGLQVEPVLKPTSLWELLKGMAKLVLQYLGITRSVQKVVFARGRGELIGKIGMQLSLVDITGIPGVEIGTVADIPVRRTAVSSDVPKLYWEEKPEVIEGG